MNRADRRKYKRDIAKHLNKLAYIVSKVHNDNGWDKMYIAINTYNSKDRIVLPYIGNEHLSASLGCDVVLKLDGEEHKDRVLVLCSIDEDNHIRINDGQSEWVR